MPLAKAVRHSPLYLYLKLYSLSLLVTLFASAPVSRRLSRDHLQRIEQIRKVAEEAFRSRAADGRTISAHHLVQTRFVRQQQETDIRRYQAQEATQQSQHHSPSSFANSSSVNASDRSTTALFPYALKTMAFDADTKFPAQPLQGATQKLGRVLRRWGRRLRDLSTVKTGVHADHQETRRFPELLLDAQIRSSHKSHRDEQRFVRTRSQHIAESKILSKLIDLKDHEQDIHPDDIPTLAIGGSGGGYRAHFGFMSSLHALQCRGWLEVTYWLAGVSGSCWTIASLYTISRLDAGKLIEHCKSVAHEGFHPMSRQALDAVARSSKGVYFLLAPLLSKLRSRVVTVGIMDMYATLTTTYQLLSRSPHARPRLSRSTFQFSKMWNRMRLSEGLAPMPIFTAVRVMHRNNNNRDEANRKEKGIARSSPPKVSAEELDGSTLTTTIYERETDAVRARRSVFPRTTDSGRIRYQWWEMNPLEIGSSDEGAWVPSWSYGRSFMNGSSITTAPEISLSLLLGQATSAPAGPLTGYISTLLATLPKGTVMSYLLAKVNTFVQQKRWEKRWGNPIRGADEPNPLFGMGTRSMDEDDTKAVPIEGLATKEWESKRRLKLMDSGLSNNLPNHVFTSSARRADIIISFDMSSDVQTGAALSRLHDFAEERNLFMAPSAEIAELPPHPLDEAGRKDSKGIPLRKNLSTDEMERRFQGHYAQVIRAWYRDDLPEHDLLAFPPGLSSDHNETPKREPHLYIVYCPLLPHRSQPEYDPVTAPFSTSYNLVWTAEEIETIARTAQASAYDHIIPALKHTYRSVYESKKAARMERERGESGAM